MDEQNPPASAGHMTQAQFTTTVDRQQHRLFTFLRGLVGDEEQAYDLMQDTLHDAWHAACRGRAPFVVASNEDERRRWLFQVAYHKGISILRQRRRLHWESLDRLLGLADEPGETSSFEEQIAEGEALGQAMTRLAPQDRACLLLRVAQGLSAAEVSQIVGASPPVVAKRLSRAKQRLRALYLASNSLAEESH